MRKSAFLAGMIFMLSAGAACAGEAELRDVAQQYGCPVKKITLLRQKVGPDGYATYKVDCNLPKASEQKDNAAQPAITVTCRLNLCQVAK